MRIIGLVSVILFTFLPLTAGAQELQVKININSQQVQGTDKSVFENLKETLERFINEQQWTALQFQENERIQCTFNITVSKYDAGSNRFTCNALIQASRPVYNSAYNTTLYNNRDKNFDFDFAEFDQLNFNEDMIDNQLVALCAYYAYLIIGLDLDSFSPMGGTDVLHRVERIVSDAQSLSEPGWKAFGNTKNRHAIINDYMETSMEPFRQLMYKYHRQGLDEMASNVDRGRTAITESIEMLKEAYDNRPLSMLPQIFTDYKRDELVNIYRGHGNSKEKDSVYEILLKINATQNNEWKKIQK